MRSIDEQIEGMARFWASEFKLIGRDAQFAMWEGVLTPAHNSYRVRIICRVPLAIENVTRLAAQPKVQVLDPLLKRHPTRDLPIPHVYINKDDASLPYLCLFDPSGAEWTLDDLIAKTTVPWISTYLLFYEGWLLTGKWFAKERHPTDADEGAAEKRSSSIRRHENGYSPAAPLA